MHCAVIYKFHCLFIYLLVFSTMSGNKGDHREDVEYVLKELKEGAPHGDLFEVTYGETTVDHNTELTKDESKTKPVIEVDNTKLKAKNQFLTLVVIDPDAPSRDNPANGPYLHYIVANAQKMDFSDGTTICNYMGPSPPSGTGPHRYVFLLYISNDTVQHDKVQDSQRKQFHIRDFVRKNNLGLEAAKYFTTSG
ncbi:unnamed protein product [Didymodactylos carnosus]|uniref:Uncharacterized protein n=1 Tax=Didymodactylos carnosus TaxID=1234261 RepID=A0A813QSQ8_9BILA|nr:unnamed protein product [Didymodactylos carnosus]CAF0772656.1 unnamed protein product [Didymodactylos carnosus]CAF3493215.1 unnamed protein product [Didymodactylos carnosus]CAF3554922.1 unnamed protein product [Didymodactylos carnosus]